MQSKESSDRTAEQYCILDYLTAIMLIQNQPRTIKVRIMCTMTWLKEVLNYEALQFFVDGTS